MVRSSLFINASLALLLISACEQNNVKAPHSHIIKPVQEAGAAKESDTKTISPTLSPDNEAVVIPSSTDADYLLPSPGPRSASSAPGLFGGGGGGRRHNVERASDHTMDILLHWNHMSIDASGVDHAQPSTIYIEAIREQLGPGRSSRAMAIVHIAIFEAINAIHGGYQSYAGLPRVRLATSMEAAIAQAAHDTLTAMFPSQEASFLEQLIHDLEEIEDGYPKERGIALGHAAADAVLSMRVSDGSNQIEPFLGIDFFPSNDPGKWRQDPVSLIPIALGANWGSVAPFVMTSGDQFRIGPPPVLNSPEYTQAFKEVKELGGDGISSPSNRTHEQTEIGIFWAYDGVPNLCAPPRLYNQIAVTIAQKMGTDMIATARLLALINVAMADAAIAIWESKYYYQTWRPITGIREADLGTGPSNLGDGNPDTLGDPDWTPLGAPASNMSNAPNFTPPFPAYPSGHAGFGGAIFQVLREFYQRDHISFQFTSDEYNGVTKDREGKVRPLKPRNFVSLSHAEEENGQSRIYLGIHWAFDKTEGIAQGHKVGTYVFEHLFRPAP